MDRDSLKPGLRVGLTGGIGSGKSTVARRFGAHGDLVIDVDASAHWLTAPGGAALPAIAAAFGADMIAADGSMDRARMRARVFADPAEKLRLEAILHPMIGALTREAEGRAQPGQTIVFDIPLLTESKAWRQRVDRILVVDCPESTQVQRVMQRSGWSAQAVERVIAQQASRAQRRAIADAVIFNDGLSLPELEAAVDRVRESWRA